MLQYASITGLVKTILIILLIWYGVKILLRLFAPFLVKYVAKKAEQKFGQQFGQSQNQQTKQYARKKEGEISIDKMPKQSKSSNNNVGEYVDFEEIE
ncbi:MAG: DUF4834 family protein [Flavobacteriaceae bacterium]|nr:DUF4834 family protein [Flavobacteriaceae bacterium]